MGATDTSQNTHASEIVRWANSPDGTKVWNRHKNSESKFWYLVEEPRWHKDRIYIVNDEYAELRKAEIDGKTIEYNSIGGEWYSTHKKLNWNYPITDYRIKPDEPIYYWEWEIKEKDGIIRTSLFMTDNYVSETRFVENGWRKVESSKRTWED